MSIQEIAQKLTKGEIRIRQINHISIAEMVNDNNGKTSPSKFCGVLISVVSTLTFAYSVMIKYGEGISQSVLVIGIGTALIATNKIVNGKNESTTNTTDAPSI